MLHQSQGDNAFQIANAETGELLKDRKLFVGNLSWKTVSAELTAYFQKFGPCDANVVTDRTTGKSKSFGFVTFFSKECAQAVAKMPHEIDGKVVVLKTSIDGRQRAKEDSAKVLDVPAACQQEMEFREQDDNCSTEDWGIWKGEQRDLMMQKFWPLFQKRKNVLKQRLLDAIAKGAALNQGVPFVSAGFVGANLPTWAPVGATAPSSWGPY